MTRTWPTRWPLRWNFWTGFNVIGNKHDHYLAACNELLPLMVESIREMNRAFARLASDFRTAAIMLRIMQAAMKNPDPDCPDWSAPE